MTADPAVLRVAALAIGWLFAHGAWHKLRAPGDFIATLTSYGLLPGAMVRPTAALLVATEIGTALGAALGFTPALLAAAALLGLYATAMAVTLLRDRELLDCGCGGRRNPFRGGWSRATWCSARSH